MATRKSVPKGQTVGEPVRFVKLNRLHCAETALAASRMSEAEGRVVMAQKDLRQAQKDFQRSQEEAQATVVKILEEMVLDGSNVVDVDALVVRPPQGQEFVVVKRND